MRNTPPPEIPHSKRTRHASPRVSTQQRCNTPSLAEHRLHPGITRPPETARTCHPLPATTTFLHNKRIMQNKPLLGFPHNKSTKNTPPTEDAKKKSPQYTSTNSKLSFTCKKVRTRCRCPPHMWFLAGYSSPFMRLAEHLRALRAVGARDVLLVGENPTLLRPGMRGSIVIRLRLCMN